MTAAATTDIVTETINAIRFLAVDAIEEANSGHPGAPLGLAPLAYSLYTRHMRHDPSDPAWPDRDRFVLSNGHASMLLYATLHLAGYDIPLDQIRNFRQWGSITPGHPERGHVDTPGVEVTTGPLGQGFGNAVGLAVAERAAAARFNTTSPEVVDHRTWCIAGDGCLMEGVQSEAASLAGFLGLGKLTVFYDDNFVTLSGPTSMSFHEDVRHRFAGYGWHVTYVSNVNDLEEIDRAIAECLEEPSRPSLVITRSHIGYGSPVEDTFHAHGSPLGNEGVESTREALGWTHPPFEIPAEVYAHVGELVAQRANSHDTWNAAFAAWQSKDSDLAAEFERRLTGKLPDGWDADLPSWQPGEDAIPTRKAGGLVMNALAPTLPELIGGSADLDPSTYTYLNDSGHFGAQHDDAQPGPGIEVRRDWAARNIEFGVREHGMGAITNGIAAHGLFRPFCATFFVFSDYMRPAVRLAALSHLDGIFVYTHDSVFLGQDGPTHQPVEHLASLRAMPNLWVFRPADPNETAQAWRVALARTEGPTALVLSRQSVPVLDPDRVRADEGGYVYADGDDVCLVATGSEVSVALDARDLLAAEGIAARVVSLPCWERFAERPVAEQHAVLPPDMPTLAVEAAATFGWERWNVDAVVGLDRFGASAPASVLAEKFGFTAPAVAAQATALVRGA
ncbi:MAG: transketolase [Acidimicrobiia bacterium]|nr:transketolase [Acidimicrobiia bacterium]